MKISGRFTAAVHMMCYIAEFEEEEKVTSDRMALSVQVNPVIIRGLMSRLKAAGLIRVEAGTGGTRLAKSAKKITLLDIFRAADVLDPEEGLFHFHENPSDICPVGKYIHPALDRHLKDAQKAMEKELRSVTLEDVLKDLKKASKKY
ncbi:MAG: Rrf2 family transcriptional regulator [Oscillospiraceae bacterium]|nr:Rrf2 family transcriptional regulator [Oscillospiraceae bacterium]